MLQIKLRNMRYWWISFLVTVIVSLLLAACGDSPTATNTPPTTRIPTTTTTTTTVPITPATATPRPAPADGLVEIPVGWNVTFDDQGITGSITRRDGQSPYIVVAGGSAVCPISGGLTPPAPNSKELDNQATCVISKGAVKKFVLIVSNLKSPGGKYYALIKQGLVDNLKKLTGNPRGFVDANTKPEWSEFLGVNY